MWIEVEMNFTFVLRMKKEFTKQMNDIKLIIEFVRQVKAWSAQCCELLWCAI